MSQLASQQKNNKKKSSPLKTIYTIYHYVAKVFLYSLLVILILVAIAFILYFIDQQINIKTGKNKQPLFGAYIIISPSMHPTIKVEDAIVIQRKEPDELKVDDIITFLSSDPRYSGLTITHRIVGIEKSRDGQLFFRTKGDNNNSEDSTLVKPDNVYGKVILKIPKIGYIQYLLTTAYGWIFVIVIPCLGVVIYDILKIFKSLKTARRKKKNTVKMVKEAKAKIEVIDTKQKQIEELVIENKPERKEEIKSSDDIEIL